MFKTPSKTIILTAVVMMTILTLTLPSLTLNGLGQTNTQIQNTKGEEVAINILIEPDKDALIDGLFKVSDFAFVPSNASTLCPTGDCEYELEDGKTLEGPNQRTVFGTFKVDTGDSTKIMEMTATYKPVEERQADGETIQVVEGKLGIGKESYLPEIEYEINGTQTTDGENFIVELRGTK